jgi:hypothetical protein
MLFGEETRNYVLLYNISAFSFGYTKRLELEDQNTIFAAQYRIYGALLTLLQHTLMAQHFISLLNSCPRLIMNFLNYVIF